MSECPPFIASKSANFKSYCLEILFIEKKYFCLISESIFYLQNFQVSLLYPPQPTVHSLLPVGWNNLVYNTSSVHFDRE